MTRPHPLRNLKLSGVPTTKDALHGRARSGDPAIQFSAEDVVMVLVLTMLWLRWRRDSSLLTANNYRRVAVAADQLESLYRASVTATTVGRGHPARDMRPRNRLRCSTRIRTAGST